VFFEDHAIFDDEEVQIQSTDGGKRIDDHQVLAERVAYAVTEGRAARAALDFAAALREEGRSSAIAESTFAASVADLVESLRVRLAPAVDDLGIGEEALEAAFPAELRALLRRVGHESVYRSIGRQVTDTRGRNELPLDEMSEQIRESVREFAEAEVAPQAEHIHRTDALVPEALIGKMSELGYFGMAVPEEYGGGGMGNLVMIVTTEELSAASLAAIILWPKRLSSIFPGPLAGILNVLAKTFHGFARGEAQCLKAPGQNNRGFSQCSCSSVLPTDFLRSSLHISINSRVTPTVIAESATLKAGQ